MRGSGEATVGRGPRHGLHRGAAHLELSVCYLDRELPRIRVRARPADASIRNRLTAFSTGLAPSRMRPYIITVSGESDPTNISVVLKFSNDIRNEMAAEPIRAGRR